MRCRLESLLCLIDSSLFENGGLEGGEAEFRCDDGVRPFGNALLIRY
jgi:hypothetical protein